MRAAPNPPSIHVFARSYHKASSLDSQQRLSEAAKSDTVTDGELLLAVNPSTQQASASAARLPNGKVQVTLEYQGNSPLLDVFK
jgi:hypothetical protein